MNRATLMAKLKELIRGSVVDDEEALQRFSRDQSIYEIPPLAAVRPQDEEEIARLIHFARDAQIPITPRGGGSGTAGGALGEGIVLALPRGGSLSRMHDFSEQGREAFVTAQAGVFHRTLQAALRERGYYLPADVSSAGISQIGGNVATKASGPHALRHGAIHRFVEGLVFITDRGERVDTGDPATVPVRIRDGLSALGERIARDRRVCEQLNARRFMKTASGYNMVAFTEGLPADRLIAQVLTGSVGTLGVVTAVRLRALPLELEKCALLLSFENLSEAGDAVCALLDHPVAAVEIMSRETVRILKAASGTPRAMLPDAHVLLVETEGPGATDTVAQINDLIGARRYRLLAQPSVLTADAEIAAVWELRKQALPVLNRVASGRRALAVINDVGVPPADLAAFIAEVEGLFEKHQTEAIVYGHAGNGNLHLRPLFDLRRPGLARRIQQLADDVYTLVLRYGGTIAAEHGMGRLKAPYLKREWGEALYGYMRELKSIFDPEDIFNPGVMFSNRPLTDHLAPEFSDARGHTAAQEEES